MKLADLNAQGAFVDSSLIPVTKTWLHVRANGKGEAEIAEDEVKFFVRRASHTQFKRAMAGMPEGAREKVEGLDPECLLVCACIRLGDDGEEQLTYEQAESLEPALFKLFIDSVNDTYGSHIANPKPSTRKPNSGANSSRAASGAGRSGKRKKTSPKTKS